MSRMRNPNRMDTVTKAGIETISATGYRLDIAADGHGTYAVTAVAADGERFVVRRADFYLVVIELAQHVGIDLEDG